MVEVADIKDRDDLHAWLKGRPQRDAVFIAARAALRVVPLWWRDAREFESTPLPALRCCLISPVAAKIQTDDIKAAAAHAVADDNIVAIRAAVRAAACSDDAAYATNADVAAARAADAASAASFAASFPPAINLWDHTWADAEVLVRSGPQHWPPLWEGDTPFAKEWSDIQKDYTGDHWAFWIDWYRRMLAGDPLPEGYLDLLHEIATMPDEDWQGSEDEVNGRIAEVWEKYLDRDAHAVTGQQEVSSMAMGSNHYGKHLKTLGLQAQTFKTYLETEIEVLRGNNAPLSAEDSQSKDDLIRVLKSVAEKVTAMIEALETQKPSTALAIVEEKTTEIAKITDELPNSKINAEPAAHMVMFAAHVKMLTESGTPGNIASAMAAAEMGRKYLARFWPFGKKS